jgi:hypothetical protein
MPSIYELKKEHELAMSELEFAEDDLEIFDILHRIEGDVSRKLEFLTTILAEAITKSDISKEAYRSAVARLDKNKKRDERVVEKLREFILSILVDFGIDKFKGPLLNVSHLLTAGSVVLSERFNIDKIPDEFITVIPERKELNNKAITEALRLRIYNTELKKLDPDTPLVVDNSLPGLMLERKQSLRVS